MKEIKKNLKSIILVLLIALCVVFSKNIRYLVTGGGYMAIGVPTGFYFDIKEQGNGDLYEIDGLNSKATIEIDKKYLNNDDTHLYVTGQYWNSPETPLVKFNGKVVGGVRTSNTGHAGSVFSDIYFSKNYHFDINDRIEAGKEYTFYIRIGNLSKSIDVTFVAE